MKKFLLLFVLISGLFFGQQKELYKSISYKDVVTLYNSTLKLENESLKENIERCKYIIDDARKNGNEDQLSAFTIFLKGLTEAENKADNSAAFLSVYKDQSSYNFYDSANKFVGRIYKEKFDDTLTLKGDKTETFIESYYYLLQE